MRLSKQLQVSWPPAETFRNVADFENAAEWDPGITEAAKLTDGPVRVGSEFDVATEHRLALRPRQRPLRADAGRDDDLLLRGLRRRRRINEALA